MTRVKDTYMHGLESLDVNPESYGDLLIPIVMKKLPEEVRRIMLRSHDKRRGPWLTSESNFAMRWRQGRRAQSRTV